MGNTGAALSDGYSEVQRSQDKFSMNFRMARIRCMEIKWIPAAAQSRCLTSVHSAPLCCYLLLNAEPRTSPRVLITGIKSLKKKKNPPHHSSAIFGESTSERGCWELTTPPRALGGRGPACTNWIFCCRVAQLFTEHDVTPNLPGPRPLSD